MSGMDRLTDGELDTLANAGVATPWAAEVARELLAHRRASQAAPAHEDDLAVDRFGAVMKAKLAKKRNDGRGGWSGPECSEETLSRMLRDHVVKGDPVDVANFAMMLHQRGERIAQAAPALSKTDREWLIALLTHDQGELLNAYGVGAEVRQSDPELHGFAVAQADAILERLSQSSELAQINAMLMEGQGDDDGPQILPDFEPDWSVTAKVEACLFLLEKRRDVIAARAPSDGLREALARRILDDAISSAEDDMRADLEDAEDTGEHVDVGHYEIVLSYETAQTIRAALTPAPAQEGGE